MKRQAYDSLVERLDKEFKAHPKLYRFRLFLFAALGYTYIFLILLFAAFLLAFLIWLFVQPNGKASAVIQAIIWVGILLFVILRSLWVVLEPPSGCRLKHNDAKPLFDTIAELKRALKSPPIHRVILDHQINASVMQRPNFGIFGWNTNYLIIGMPLMVILTPKQLKAVLAHELGHLSGAHGIFSAWIYRIRTTWLQLRSNTSRRRFSFLFRRFFEWYVPRFDAYSFIIVREHEKIADAFSAKVTGEKEAADAFINMEAIGPFISDEFYKEVYSKQKDQPEPPEDVYGMMAKAIVTGITPERAAKSLEKAKARKSSTDDPHPSFLERLAALKYGISFSGVPQESAASYYMGAGFAEVKTRMNNDWKKLVSAGWTNNYNEAWNARKSLSELEAKAATSPLIASEMRELGYAVEVVKGPEAAIPVYREALKADPKNMWLNFTLGRLLIKQEDKEEGLEYLKNAAEKDLNVPFEAHRAIYDYLVEHGKENEAKVWQDRSTELIKEAERGMQERYSFKAGDKYEPHSLPEPEIERLRKQLSRFPEVKEAFYVRKKVKRFPDSPFFILGIITTRKWFVYESDKWVNGLRQRLNTGLNFPYATFIGFFDARERTWFPVGKIKKLPGSRIYKMANKG